MAKYTYLGEGDANNPLTASLAGQTTTGIAGLTNNPYLLKLAETEFSKMSRSDNNIRQLLTTGQQALSQKGINTTGLSDKEVISAGFILGGAEGSGIPLFVNEQGKNYFNAIFENTPNYFTERRGDATSGRLGAEAYAAQKLGLSPGFSFDLFNLNQAPTVDPTKSGGQQFDYSTATDYNQRVADTMFLNSGKLSNTGAGQETIQQRMARTGETLQDIQHAMGTQQVAYDFAQQKPVPQALSPQNLAPAQSTNLPGAEIIGGEGANIPADSAVSGARNVATPKAPELLPLQKQEQSILDAMTKLIEEDTGKGAEQAKLEAEAKIAEQKANVQRIADTIAAKTNEFEAYKLQQEGKPITMASITGSIAQKRNQIASEILLLQGEAYIAQGQLAQAQDSVNRAIDLKYSTIENKYKILSAQLQAIQPSLQREEKAQALALQREYEAQQQATQDAKDIEKLKASVVAQQMAKYADAGILFTDTPEDIKIKLAGSKIYQDQVRLLGGSVNTTSSGALWSSGPPTTSTPTAPKQTFEQFLAQEENKAGQSFGQAKRDELRKQFEANQVVPTAKAQNADISMYDIAVQQVILGNEPVSSVTSGGTAGERARAQTQLKDAESRGLLQQRLSKTQQNFISGLNDSVSKSETYKKTNSMRTFAGNVTAALSLGTGVGDIAAINQFQKVIDEGAVTRDQDVKLIQSAQSLANTLNTKIAKLQKGDQLSPETRSQMRSAVNSLYEAQIKALSLDPFIKAKIKEAESFNVSVTDTILGELGAFQSQASSGLSNPTGQTAGGNTYQIIP